MTQIDNLTSFADQDTILFLADGSSVPLNLTFHAASERWVASISYGAININGIGVCAHPNLLRQWKNVLPFGISCVTADMTDPFDINDFSTGRVLLYLLNSEDVLQVESQVFTAP